jgi:lysophospholipase
LGLSIGGHLVLRALTEGAATPDAAVLIAPMLGLRSPLGAALGERFARLIGGLGDAARPAWKANEKPGTTATRQSLLTYDPDRYEDELWWQSAQPELLLGPPSWLWVIEAFASTRRLQRDPRLRTMNIPILMIIAMADQLVLPRAALGIATKLPDARVVRFGKESAHEVLREADPVRNRAIAEIDMFLSSRVTEGK